MAINLPDGKASYSFQHPQKYAIQLRLTPEVKQALLKAQQKGQTGSLRLTGTAADNVCRCCAASSQPKSSLEL